MLAVICDFSVNASGKSWEDPVFRGRDNILLFDKALRFIIIFQKYFENFIEFLAKIWTKISTSAFVGGSGGGTPRG